MSLLGDALKEMDFEFGQNSPSCGGNTGEQGKLVDFHRMGSEEEEMPEDMPDDMGGNGRDTVSMDVPFLIRILELTRENIKDDAALHDLADRLVSLSQSGEPITMDHYDEFREFEGNGEEGYGDEEGMDDTEGYGDEEGMDDTEGYGDEEGMDDTEGYGDEEGMDDTEGYGDEEDCEMASMRRPITIESLLKLGEGKGARKRTAMYRRPRTQSERKATAEGGARGKRSAKNLPSEYDDKPISRAQSWSKRDYNTGNVSWKDKSKKPNQYKSK